MSILAGAATIPVLMYALGADGFSGWALLLACAALFTELQAAIPTSLVRHLAVPLESADRAAVDRIASTGAASAFLTFGLWLPVITLSSGALARFLRLPPTRHLAPETLLVVVFAAVGARAVLQIGSIGFVAARAFGVATALSSAQPIVSNLAAMIAALATRDLAITVVAFWTGQLLVVGAGAVLAARRLGWRLRPSLVSWSVGRKLFGFGLAAQTSEWARLVNVQYDKFVLVRTGGLWSVALYEIASRAVTALRSVPAAGFETFLPTATLRAADGSDAPETLHRMTSFAATAVLVFVGVPLVVAPLLLYAWVGQLGGSAVNVFVLLGLSASAGLLGLPLATHAQAIARPELPARAAILSLAVNLPASLALAWIAGPEGAAAGTALASIAGLTFLWISVHRAAGERPGAVALRQLQRHAPATLVLIAIAVLLRIGSRPAIALVGALFRSQLASRALAAVLCVVLALACGVALVWVRSLTGLEAEERVVLTWIRGLTRGRRRDFARRSRVRAPLWVAALVLAGAALLAGVAGRRIALTPSHPRPYFMPDSERARIRSLVENDGWAKAELERVRAAAAKDGYWAAFLVAYANDRSRLDVARSFLRSKYGFAAYWTKKTSERLDDPAFFAGGQKGIPEVYYDVGLTGLVAFDWAWPALTPAEREEFSRGIAVQARYRQKAMDTWTQTPNLVFKPSCVVGLSGLTIGDAALAEWGFFRIRLNPGIGGIVEVVASMLVDGLWREANAYPIAHRDVELMGNVSRLVRLATGRDLFSLDLGGGSARDLAASYIDLAYPMERSADGERIRVATYGDAGTGPGGDLWLTGGKGHGLDATATLESAWSASSDPRFAAFLALGAYRPDLAERPPLPSRPELPSAPSRLFPRFGVAMLRSEESSAYWTSGRSMAVLAMGTRGYGHDHRDKLGITFHAHGRLFYPDYNAIQYENPAIGWSRAAVSHNTVVVDGGDPRDAEPTAVVHGFTPDVKALVTSASQLHDGVDETRALFLTGEYLLDAFTVSSDVPHTYDWVVHAFGDAKESDAGAWAPSDLIAKRYWLLDGARSLRTDAAWSLDLAQDGTSVRVSMAGAPDTAVTHAVWGEELAREVARGKKTLDRLSSIVVRRVAQGTIFAATHEPVDAGQSMRVRSVRVAGRTEHAVLLRVEGDGFVDYAAAALGDEREHVVAVDGTRGAFASFRGWAYARVVAGGAVRARGAWNGLSLPAATGPLSLEGRDVTATRVGGLLTWGTRKTPEPPISDPPEAGLEARFTPETARLFPRDRRTLTMTLTNPADHALEGEVAIDDTPGVHLANVAAFSVPAKSSARVPITLIADNAVPGRRIVAVQLHIRTGAGVAGTAAFALPVAVSHVLTRVYEKPAPFYRIDAPRMTARLTMRHGLCTYLADDDDEPIVNGEPLFTFEGGGKPQLDAVTTNSFTWPNENPASLVAQENDQVRWQALAFGDRLLIRLDPAWTRFPEARFTIPGAWADEKARWVRAVDGEGRPRDVPSAGPLRVSAVELAIPGRKWNLALAFDPPREVTFAGKGLLFVQKPGPEAFSVGFCRPGDLEAWRGSGR